VLPSTMQTEHFDIHDSVSHLFLNFNNPVAEPPGECLSHTEIFRGLAAKMDLSEPALFASDLELIADALKGDHPALAGIKLDELRLKGFVRLGYPEPFLPYAERFDTPSGRFEFVSSQAEANGHGRVPHYVAPREATRPTSGPDGSGESLALIAAANHYLMNSMFANSSAHSKAGPPVIALHPDDALSRGLEQGAAVRVHNDRGEFAAALEVSVNDRIGVATMTKGHWPKLWGGATVNATTAEDEADMGSGGTFHDNQVFITAVGQRRAEVTVSQASR